MFTSENNWYSWQYGNEEPFGNQPSNLEFKTHFAKCSWPVGNFSTELKIAAASTLEYFPGLQPTILFSGGIDSEVVLRTYKSIGANPRAVIMRYENDINILDVSYAITICSALDIKFQLIDFNLKKFFENDAEYISELSQIDYPRALPQLKFLDYADNDLLILGAGDMQWHRKDDNYNIKGIWTGICYENEIGWSKYIKNTNCQAIGEWFKWTPGLVIAYTRLKWFRKLINDEFHGKLGVKSTKLLGYREAYPDLLTRKKMTGFEPIDELIEEFENHLSKKYDGLPFRRMVRRSLQDLEDEILLGK